MTNSAKRSLSSLFHLDGWANLFSGMGIRGIDKKELTSFIPNIKLTERQLIDIYSADGIGTRIIDVYTEDLTRKWFTVSDDNDKIVDKELVKFKGHNAIIECVRWALLHGGCVGVVGIKDGGLYEDPVNESQIDEITHIHVYDKWRTLVQVGDLYADVENPKYGTPEFYWINPLRSTPFAVHESRILRFDGKPTPEQKRIENNFWNDSYLVSGYERIKGLGSGYNSIEAILDEFIVGVLKVNNLQAMIASGKEDQITKRLTLMDMCRRTMGTVLMDNNEEFTRISSTVTGLADLIDKLIEAVSMCYGIPVTRLVGRSPAGMNATGESDLAIYYDKIEQMRMTMLNEPISKLMHYLSLAKKSKFKSTNIEINYPPLKTMDPLQVANIKKLNSDADCAYLDRNVIQAGEVATSRFSGDKYGDDIKLTVKRDKDGNLPEPEPSDEELAAYAAQLNGNNNDPTSTTKTNKEDV
jgi:uncharacterized protein